uniref:Secreted protein n=1 Tax=Steinernema glaseri TaxID=37863 RepID=A0A1I7XZX4_9BILA
MQSTTFLVALSEALHFRSSNAKGRTSSTQMPTLIESKKGTTWAVSERSDDLFIRHDTQVAFTAKKKKKPGVEDARTKSKCAHPRQRRPHCNVAKG